jgi:sporulation protein YlmC with PRC-barrel domain
MAKQEIHVELLVGRRVRAMNGWVIGRLEEIRVKQESRGAFVEEFLTGSYGLLERLAALSIGRAILKAFGARRKSYRIPWDQLDLSDPEKPRLRCEVSELRTITLFE